jgi:hypothetical protein
LVRREARNRPSADSTPSAPGTAGFARVYRRCSPSSKIILRRNLEACHGDRTRDLSSPDTSFLRSESIRSGPVFHRNDTCGRLGLLTAVEQSHSGSSQRRTTRISIRTFRHRLTDAVSFFRGRRRKKSLEFRGGPAAVLRATMGRRFTASSSSLRDALIRGRASTR